MVRRVVLGVLGTSLLAISAFPFLSILTIVRTPRAQTLPSGFDGDC